MGIRFLAGRDLAASDNATAPPVIVINRAAAAQLFGKSDPVGQFVEWNLDTVRQSVQVVGTVEQLRNESLEQEPYPEIIDYRQLVAVLQRRVRPLARGSFDACCLASRRSTQAHLSPWRSS